MLPTQVYDLSLMIIKVIADMDWNDSAAQLVVYQTFFDLLY